MSTTDAVVDQERLKTLESIETVVVKVGTRVLTAATGGLDRDRIESLSAQLCRCADGGRQTILVSSGAVAAGVGKLGLPERPTGVARLQAVAAVGQADLIRQYEQAFSKHGRHAAQVLLTAGDLRRRTGFLNVRNALAQIHALGAIPVINENDSVAVAELMTTFGDNDRLAAAVASLLSNTLLIILSDVQGVYDKPPSEPGAQVIPLVKQVDNEVLGLARDTISKLSRGGMSSKLKAAQMATTHGHPVVIAGGRTPNIIDAILAGKNVGTMLLPGDRAIKGRRRWIGGAAEVAGKLLLDAGAAKALAKEGRSLLAIGVTGVQGEFSKGAVVSIVSPDGQEIARGLTNYSATDLRRILGKRSDEILAILGQRPYEEVIHRDNMVRS